MHQQRYDQYQINAILRRAARDARARRIPFYIQMWNHGEGTTYSTGLNFGPLFEQGPLGGDPGEQPGQPGQ